MWATGPSVRYGAPRLRHLRMTSSPTHRFPCAAMPLCCCDVLRRGVQRLGRRTWQCGRAQHGKDRQLLLQAFERELAEGFRFEAAEGTVDRVLRDDDLPRFRDAALEARGDVHGAAED